MKIQVIDLNGFMVSLVAIFIFIKRKWNNPCVQS